MIRDSFKNLEKYKFIHKDIPAVIEFFKNKNLQDGRYEISDDCFINVSSYETKEQSYIQYETHRVYADIQVMLSGEETHFYQNVDKLKMTQEYTPDVELYMSEDKKFLEQVNLFEDDFVIYLPQEPHAPGYAYDNSKKVKKAIVKLKF